MGESTHGSAQIPAAAADLLRLATDEHGLSVWLGLEMEEPAGLDAFLDSNGGDAAIGALLQCAHWRFEDGRASEAILALLEQARCQRMAGTDVHAFGFDEAVSECRGGARHAAAMAKNALAAIERAAADALTLLVAGSSHSRVRLPGALWRLPPPMGALVREKLGERVVSLVAGHAGGTVFAYETIDGEHTHAEFPQRSFRPGPRRWAWSGAKTLPMPHIIVWGAAEAARRGETDGTDPSWAYDGCLHLGALTPSLPARRVHPPPDGTSWPAPDPTRPAAAAGTRSSGCVTQ